MWTGEKILQMSCDRWWCRKLLGPITTERMVPMSRFDPVKGEYVDDGEQCRVYCSRCGRGASA